MNSRTRLLALGSAMALALHPVAVAAQTASAPCLREDEVSAMAIYAMPGVVQGVRLRCAGQLTAGGFIAQGGDVLSDRYAKLQPAAWPKAKSGLLKIAATRSDRMSANSDGLKLLSSLPDSAVRPLVEALIVQELSPEIDMKHCGRIELLMQALDKVDPQVAGTLLGLIAGLVKLDEPAMCAGPRA